MRYVLPALASQRRATAQRPNQESWKHPYRKWACSSKTPTAVRHGPASLGGLDILDLRTELGILND
jgi:hypothetical protein